MEPETPTIAVDAAGRGIAFSRHERERHLFMLGKSGSGKSTAMFNLAMHDIHAGHGVMVLDPHGDLAEALIDALPSRRTNEVCYLNVADVEYPVGFNPLAGVPAERHALAAAGIVSAFKHLWGHQSWGPRLEHFLFNGVMALLVSPRPSLLDLSRLYIDARFRKRSTARLTDTSAQRFWLHEYPQYDERYRTEAAGPILNKVGQIAASPVLRNILGQHAPKFDLSYAMDHQRILICNLAKGRIGEQASDLLGSLLLSHLQLVSMARSAQTPEEREAFFVHVDEYGSFVTDAFASLMSEARKFATYLVLAGQFLDQVSPAIRAAVLGNAGTLMIFRVSAADAQLLAPEFNPITQLPASALIDQPPFRAWLRRTETGSRTIFLEPPLFPARGRRNKLIAQSRRHFGGARRSIK